MIKKTTGFYNNLSSDMQGVLLMILACFWFSIMASLIRYTTTDLNPFVVVFFRNLFSFICLIPLGLKLGIQNIKTNSWNLYFTRVVSGVFGMSFIFYSISILPLTNVTALTFTVPIITTFFAIIYLGEKVKLYHFVALSIGFAGVMIIVRPGAESFKWVSLIVVLATCCWSVSNIVVKKLTKHDEPKLIVFIMVSLMAPFSLPLALYDWQTPNITQLFWLLVLGWVSNQAQFCMTKSYKKSDITKVLPFDFSRLIFISLMAMVFFNESLEIWTVIGGIVIFSSSVYLVRKQRNENNPAKKNPVRHKVF